MNKYAFPQGKSDGDRLDIQHACYRRAITMALKELNLSYGQTVIDAGCGSGIMTEWLSHQVGPKGKVFAIDNDPGKLALCKERLSMNGINNVEYILMDLENDATEKLNADLTYCKFVIHHLQNKEAGLRNLSFLTKKGGHVLSVEPINAIHWVAPYDEYYYQLFNCYHEYAKHKNIALNFGQEIYNLSLKNKLFSHASNEGFQPITNDPFLKSYLFKGWEHIQADLVTLGHISPQECQNMTQGLMAIIQSADFIFGLPLITLLKSTVH